MSAADLQSFPRLVEDIDAEVLRLREAEGAAGLKSGRGGGTFGGMETLIDAKVAAAEARTDAKFATVIAKLDALSIDIKSTKASIWTAAFAVMALIVAIVSLIATIVPSSITYGADQRQLAREEALAARWSPVTEQPAPKPVTPAITPKKPG